MIAQYAKYPKMAARTLFSCCYGEIASFSARSIFTSHSINCEVYRRCAHVTAKTETKEGSALAKFAWLGQLSRGISVRGDKVKVYTEPDDYYELVKVLPSVYM